MQTTAQRLAKRLVSDVIPDLRRALASERHTIVVYVVNGEKRELSLKLGTSKGRCTVNILSAFAHPTFIAALKNALVTLFQVDKEIGMITVIGGPTNNEDRTFIFNLREL